MSGHIPDSRQGDLGSLSQWQLIRLRFGKHKLASTALYILIALYLMAGFAEFWAPNSTRYKNLEYAHCPPQLPSFSFSKGLHVQDYERKIDPITLKRYYIKTDRDISLNFFARGAAYELWGLIPGQRHFLAATQDPSNPYQPVYFLGADKYGRDILSRLIYGARISLTIGLVSICFTFILGIAIGGLSGYAGGHVDNLIQRIIEIINAFPQLPLWLALAAIMPASWSGLQTYFAITIVLSMINWTILARVVRGKILSLREEDYAVAARLLGASHGRILFRHLVPGFTSHIIVSLTLTIPGMILGETALSFLGLGLRAPIVSWGVMLQDTMNLQALAHYPWLLMPVLMIVMTVLAFNFLGDGLRDAADPYA